jgi:hypothetical protein
MPISGHWLTEGPDDVCVGCPREDDCDRGADCTLAAMERDQQRDFDADRGREHDNPL